MKNKTVWIIILILAVFSVTAITFYSMDEENVVSEISEERYCEVSEDCEVKDVHNCCGYYPRCVNTDYIPDVEKVIEECIESGTASSCGYPEISHCECVKNNCVSMQGNSVV